LFNLRRIQKHEVVNLWRSALVEYSSRGVLT
jgi:hypothetical protein